MPGNEDEKAKELARLIIMARSQTPEAIAERARKGRSSPVHGESAAPDEGPLGRDEKKVIADKILENKKQSYVRMVRDSDLGDIPESEKEFLASEVAEWATTHLAKNLLALSRGIKPRQPENPRRTIQEILSKGAKGATMAAREASVEKHIIKCRVNEKGEIIVSVELPLGQGGAKTVRRKLEVNLTQNKTRVFAYSRAGKFFGIERERAETEQEMTRLCP